MNPRLSLSEADRAALAGFGIAADRDGTLSTSNGEPVSAGVAVHLLRGLREGQHPQAGQEPSGQPVGFDLEATLNRVARTGVAKGLDPDAFRRGYQKPGHQSDSPANSGGWEWPAPMPEADPAMPEDFIRPWLSDGHQALSADNDPDGNNPCPPGTPGGRLYQALSGQWQANEARARAEHLEPSTMLASPPAPSRVVLPSDMRARSIPQRVSARMTAMTAMAPGEES